MLMPVEKWFFIWTIDLKIIEIKHIKVALHSITQVSNLKEMNFDPLSTQISETRP